MHLCGDHHLVPSREILERAADNFLACAVGIDIGRVEERDAELKGTLDEGPALLLVQSLGMASATGNPVGHAAETQAGNLKAGAAEPHVIHDRVLLLFAVPTPASSPPGPDIGARHWANS